MKGIKSYIIGLCMLVFLCMPIYALSCGSLQANERTTSSYNCSSCLMYRADDGYFYCTDDMRLKQVSMRTLNGAVFNSTAISLIQEPIEEPIYNLQETSGISNEQIGTNLDYFEERVELLETENANMTDYITAVILIYIEFIKIGFYVIELRIIIYLLLTLIPALFFRLRDKIVDSYVRRQNYTNRNVGE